jgi:hypothetical protein
MRRDPLPGGQTVRRDAALLAQSMDPPDPLNDYQVERETDRIGPPLSMRLLRLAQGALLIVLAVLSLAVLWVLLELL